MERTQNRSGPIRLRVWGPNACFTRPEMKVERVSYDVMTPSAARGVLEAIHWKPAIRWVIDQIDVLKAIRWESVRRNEVGSVMSPSANGLFIEDQRQQRAGLFLKDVAYVIHAHFELTERAGIEDNVVKHEEIFRRRAGKGQCFHRPYLGCREFAASCALPEPEEILEPIAVTKDLGYMLLDIIHDNGGNKNGEHICNERCQAHFFRAALEDGRLIPRPNEVKP